MDSTDRPTSTDRPIFTWETACPCGLPACRSGWPADAPLPADLPDPLRFLDEQRAAGRGAR
jgi:hypothetical protein